MSKQKRRGSTQGNESRPHLPPRRLAYEITDEPVQDAAFQALPTAVQEDLERLYYLLDTDPEQALPGLIAWKAQYPRYPKLNNYLSAAYSNLKQYSKARDIIEENYREFPDYLFARVNYAELHLRDKEYDKIPALFDHYSDLQLLYPERTHFHTSEIAGFYGVMGLYYHAIGDTKQAEQVYQFLREVVPDHAMTLRLGRLLVAPAMFEALIKIVQENKEHTRNFQQNSRKRK